ncbi:HAD family phosphatase [Candidatus Peregrinibacteria bacterium]|nr:HAD family phosphatase [Candidatus Peregrinibacteria bacterium]
MIRAVIFDMDGVISDTQKIFSSVESEQLKKYGIHVTPEKLEEKYAAMSDRPFYEKIFKDYEKPLPNIETLMQKKWEKMFMLTEKNVEALPGVVKLITDLKNHNFKLAVASASLFNFIENVLQALKIKNMFDSIASSEEVKNGKPAPDVFLLAAKRLEIDPKDCIVIEDSINGMIAAKTAGMKCIGYVRKNTKKQYPADKIIENFSEMNSEKIQKL